MRKSLAAATMAASLTIGGAAGVALFTPTTSNAAITVDDTGDGDAAGAASTEADHPEPGQRLAEVIAPLVEDGTITQVQADAVVAALVEAGPLRGPAGPGGPGGHHGVRAEIGEVLSEVLGLSSDEIRAAFEEGTTLRALAEAQGVDPQAVVDALVASAQEHLATAVEDGRLTQEEADDRLAEVREHAEASLDAERPVFEGGHGPRGARGDEAPEG